MTCLSRVKQFYVTLEHSVPLKSVLLNFCPDDRKSICCNENVWQNYIYNTTFKAFDPYPGLHTIVCKQSLVRCFVYNRLMAHLFWNHGPTQRFDDENCSQSTALHENKVPSDTMVRGASKRLHLKYPASDCLMPYQRQKFGKSSACVAVIPGSTGWCVWPQVSILCPVPQQGKRGIPCSVLGSAVSSHHPACSAATKSPGARLVKGCPTAVQGWSKEPRAARAPGVPQPSPQRQKGSEVQPWWDCCKGKLRSCQIQELLLYLKLKRKEFL